MTPRTATCAPSVTVEKDGYQGIEHLAGDVRREADQPQGEDVAAHARYGGRLLRVRSTASCSELSPILRSPYNKKDSLTEEVFVRLAQKLAAAAASPRERHSP